MGVPQALNSGKPVPAAAPSSPVTAALRELGALVDGAPPPASRGLLSRLLSAGAKKGKS
jgi:MinD-like ATPase involved in chromosome partitioning or flagellar assembly